MKQIVRLGCALTLAGAGLAWAEPSTRVAWTPETLRFVNNGDPAKGKEIAQGCEGCHAVAPQNERTPIPYLRGQLTTYLYKQLHDYKHGSRVNDVMAGFAGGLSEQDMADVAAWYSQQPVAPRESGRFEGKRAESLVFRGDGKRILPPCASCHGADGLGRKVDTPSLVGQKASYLEQTLLAYKSGARGNDLYQRMRLITQQLTDAEIKELAGYYAHRAP